MSASARVRQALIASADENVIATLEADAARLASDLTALSAEELRWANVERLWRRRARVFVDAQARFDAEWSMSSEKNDEAALVNAREQIALLERSLASLKRERATRS